jgi:hypothetical protein
VDDRLFFLTSQAIRTQLAAMPNELYLVRLIHHPTGRAFPGERLWTAEQLGSAAIVRFLRVRDGEGCDVYVPPYAADHNAGYILVDLDHAQPAGIANMRAHGHGPCVVLQTSPGHLQAWIHPSRTPLEPVVATAAGKLLAAAYGGGPASTDWRYLGRLAGFTNQKPVRRTLAGYAPWGEGRGHPGWLGAASRRSVAGSTSLGGAAPAGLQRRLELAGHRYHRLARHRHLSEFDRTLAHPPTVPTARLVASIRGIEWAKK